MSDREEFEKWCGQTTWTPYQKSIMFKAWQEVTTRKQKIIDELKAREESRQRVCDDCMMRFSRTISQLEADNSEITKIIKAGKK